MIGKVYRRTFVRRDGQLWGFGFRCCVYSGEKGFWLEGEGII